MSEELLSYLPKIQNGLWSTVWISFISIVLALIPGWMLVMGKTSKNIIFKSLSSLYVLVFDGIPFLVQLFIGFFVLPQMLNVHMSEIFIAVCLLSLNSAANIAKYATLYYRNREGMSFLNSIKITILTFFIEFGEVIKLTTLVSSIGLLELLRSGRMIVMSTGNSSVMLIIVGLYLVMSIVIKIFAYLLEKWMFKNNKTMVKSNISN